MPQTFQRSPEELAEIEKHKYFLSEKAGHDVGWDTAEQDWDSNYAEQFRRSGGGASQTEGIGTFLKRLLSKAR